MSSLQGSDVARAGRLLREGGVVAFGTETVYGLGADAFNTNAVARVFDVKNRPKFDPLIVHIAERSWLSRLTNEVPDIAEKLIDRFWPGPLTVIFPKIRAVPDLVTSGLPTVAVRMPDHPLAVQLIEAAGTPIAAPSANPFGRLSPTCAEHVAEQLGGQIDYILDGGPCRVGVESTVVQVDDHRVGILRHGGITVEQLEEVIGRVVDGQTVVASGPAESPGMLPQHYAPSTRLKVVDDLAAWATSESKVGLLSLQPPEDSTRFAVIEVLSPSGNLVEAAANFFSALRRLDAAAVDLIIAKPFPEAGLGRALNDRIQRASVRA